MGGLTTLGLVFEVDADPSKAEAALPQFQQKLTTATAQATAAASADFEKFGQAGIFVFEDIQHKLIETTRTMAELRAEILVTTDAQEKFALQQKLAGVREQYTALRTEMRGMRYEMTEATEKANLLGEAIGVHIPYEIERVIARIPGIQTALQAAFEGGIIIAAAGLVMELGRKVYDLVEEYSGLSKEAKKAYDEIVKGSDEALVHVGGLTTAQRIASMQMLIMQTNQRIAFDVMGRQAVSAASYWQKVGEVADAAVSGVIQGTGKMLAIAGEMQAAQGLLTDELKANLLLQKQTGELAKLEKDLASEKEKGAKASERASQKAERLAELRKEDAARIGDLITKELEEGEALDAGSSRLKQLELSYDREVEAIDRAIAEARKHHDFTVQMAQDAARAKLLALANYHERARELREQEEQRELEAQRRLDEERRRFEDEAARSGQGSQLREQRQAETEALRAGEEAMKRYLAVAQAEPAVIAAVRAAYPGLTLAQIANNQELLKLIETTTRAGNSLQSSLNPQILKATQNLVQLERVLPTVGEQFRVTFAQMDQAHQSFVLNFLSGEDKVLTALNRELAAHASLAQALDAFYKSSIRQLADYLAQKAQLKAEEASAEALGELAIYAASGFTDGDALAAALKFGAEAVGWEALGATVSAAGGLIGGTGSGSGSSRRQPVSVVGPNAPQGAPALAAGPAGAVAAGQRQIGPQGNVTIMVMGDAQAAAWLTGTISRGVTQQGLQLSSSRAKLPTYAGR